MIQATFSRASVAHKLDGSQVAAGAPRYEAGLSGQAIMVEEGTVNLLTSPDDFSAAGWIKVGVAIAANGAADPAGGMTADTVMPTAVTSTHHLTQNFGSAADNATITLQAVAWPIGGQKLLQIQGRTKGNTYPSCVFNLETGTISSGSGSIQPMGGGFYLCTFSFAVGTGATTPGMFFLVLNDAGAQSYAGDITKGVALWWSQAEAKPYATSFINGTRNAETLSLPLSALPPQAFTVEINLLVSAMTKRQVAGLYPAWFTLGADDAAHGGGRTEITLVQHESQTNLYLIGYRNGASMGMSIPHTLVPDGWRRLALRRSGGTLDLFCDGALLVSGTPPMPDGFTFLHPGLSDWGGSHVNTLFDRIRLFNRALTDAEIRASYQGGL